MRVLAIVLVAIFLSMQVYAVDLGIKEDVSNIPVGDSVTSIFTLVGDDVERDVTFYVISENSLIVSVAGLEWYRKNFHLNATEEVEIPVKLYGESEGVAKVWYGFRGEEFEEYVVIIEVGDDEGKEIRGSSIAGSIGYDEGDGRRTQAGENETSIQEAEETGVGFDNKRDLASGGVFIVLSLTLLIIATFSGIVLKKIKEREI